MAQGRQASEWPQILSLHAAIANLFADKGKAIDVMKFVPEHLHPEAKPPREPTPAEIQDNWKMLRTMVQRGLVAQGKPS